VWSSVATHIMPTFGHDKAWMIEPVFGNGLGMNLFVGGQSWLCESRFVWSRITDPCLFGALIIFRVPFQHSRIHRLCVSAMFCLISSSMGFNMAQSNERMILGVYRNDSSVVIAGHMHHANFVIGMHRQLDG